MTVRNDLQFSDVPFDWLSVLEKPFAHPSLHFGLAIPDLVFEEGQFRDVVKYLPEEIRPVVTFAYHTGGLSGAMLRFNGAM